MAGISDLATGGMDSAIGGVSKLLDDVLGRVFPDPTAESTAKVALIKATSDAALAGLQQQMSIMLAEANSGDKWTSRARPSMMYVMYVLMLGSLPMGVLYAFDPTHAGLVTKGLQAWLTAIPDSLWNLFTFCFLGYTGGRTFEKIKGVA